MADVAGTGRDEREEQHNSIRARRGGSREEGSQQRGRNRADATSRRRAAEGGGGQTVKPLNAATCHLLFLPSLETPMVSFQNTVFTLHKPTEIVN